MTEFLWRVFEYRWLGLETQLGNQALFLPGKQLADHTCIDCLYGQPQRDTEFLVTKNAPGKLYISKREAFQRIKELHFTADNRITFFGDPGGNGA